MKDELDVPDDWSRWGPGPFQKRICPPLLVCLAYTIVLITPEANQRYAFVIVTAICVLCIGIVFIERIDAKASGKEPSPEARKILKHLPYKPYTERHEELSVRENEAIDNDWNDLVQYLL